MHGMFVGFFLEESVERKEKVSGVKEKAKEDVGFVLCNVDPHGQSAILAWFT